LRQCVTVIATAATWIPVVAAERDGIFFRHDPARSCACCAMPNRAKIQKLVNLGRLRCTLAAVLFDARATKRRRESVARLHATCIVCWLAVSRGTHSSPPDASSMRWVPARLGRPSEGCRAGKWRATADRDGRGASRQCLGFWSFVTGRRERDETTIGNKAPLSDEAETLQGAY